MSNVFVDSWHTASGSAIIKGKEWRWDFSLQFGPTFVDEHGEPLENQPGVRSAAFKAFNVWWKELQRERAEMLPRPYRSDSDDGPDDRGPSTPIKPRNPLITV